jgi:general stress protein 26
MRVGPRLPYRFRMQTERTASLLDSKTIEKFSALIHDIRFAMLTTVGSDGSLHSRPMATLGKEFDGDLWFFTDDSSGKVDEIQQERHVCVSYAEPEDQKYVSVSGVAQLVQDRQRAKELWTPAANAWLPQGVDDPRLALLRVRVQAIEYWDTPGGKMVQLYGMAKAALTGERLKHAGDHRASDVVPRKETF